MVIVLTKKKLEKIFENTSIPNPNNRGKRFIVGWRRYFKKLSKAIFEGGEP